MSEHVYDMLIAPDFSPERFAGWHMFNTLMQKHADINMHLNTPSSPVEQKALIDAGNIDIIYANPFDAATLIREQGYRAIARPIAKSDEMVIIAAAKSQVKSLEDIAIIGMSGKFPKANHLFLNVIVNIN